MDLYFSLIDPTRTKFPVTPAPSRPPTPGPETRTPIATRPPSIITEEAHFPRVNTMNSDLGSPPTTPSSPVGDSPTASAFPLSSTHRHSHSHNHLHHHLLHIALTRNIEPAVGLFESQRYLNLENNRFREPEAEANTEHSTALLQESCDDLLKHGALALAGITAWFPRVRRQRFNPFAPPKRIEANQKEKMTKLMALRDGFEGALKEFLQTKRYEPSLPADICPY